MSRSAVKSRGGERQGGRGSRSPQSAALTGPTRPQETDVDQVTVRGPLTEAQWTLMLGQEETEETVGQIMDALLANVMERCYQSFTERQLRPFCVSWTRDRVLQLVEWQFLHGAEGEPLEDHEDPEPPPGTTDSWAQGCVPVVHDGTKPPPSRPAHKQQHCPGVPVASQTDRQHQRRVSSSVEPAAGWDHSTHSSGDHSTHRVLLTPTPPPRRDRRQTRRQILSTLHSTVTPPSVVPSITSTTTRRDDNKEEQKDLLPSAPPPRCAWWLCQNTDSRAGPGLLDHSSLPRPRQGVSPHYKILDATTTGHAHTAAKRPGLISSTKTVTRNVGRLPFFTDENYTKTK